MGKGGQARAGRVGRPKKGERDTRARILAVAKRRFADAGIAGVGLRELAAEAGITPASLLHHVGSREALVEAVLRGVGEDLARRLEGVRGREDLRRRLVAWADDDPAATRLALQALLAAPCSALADEGEEAAAPAESLAAFRRAMMPLWPAFDAWRRPGTADGGEGAGAAAGAGGRASLSEIVMLLGALLFESAARDTLARMSGLTPARLHETFVRDLAVRPGTSESDEDPRPVGQEAAR